MCEPEAGALLKCGLWPATPDKPQTAFSITVLELFHYLSFKSTGSSVERSCLKNNLTLVEVMYSK